MTIPNRTTDAELSVYSSDGLTITLVVKVTDDSALLSETELDLPPRIVARIVQLAGREQ
jgi:hypothetical protein